MTAISPTEAFIARKANIDAAIARLQTLSDDHFEAHPDEVTWNHVGTLQEIERLLTRVTDFAFAEGANA